MSRMAIGSIAIVLLASLQCEPQEPKVAPLKRLRQTSILVETLDAGAKTLGLSIKNLESQMLVGLRRDIPRLAVRESAIPTLYLQVTVLRETTVKAARDFLAAHPKEKPAGGPTGKQGSVCAGSLLCRVRPMGRSGE